ncbi:MAG TPA: hypothetical protein DEA96_14995 [Leptospiraceae bacterium]|nr:hypothetical protein [Spirochaetaceae bacterium]HBS06273.1 hypothetical protein [Leptospiraceae bacterium]|tara:strand:+ start:14794 stop:16578 length:1785 start_codon:yes stop_codon:yes gene_type:complete
MRILHTSDWHLGKTLHEHSLIEDQKHFLDQLLNLLRSDPHDVLIVAGDIYDRSIPPREAVQLLSDFLSRFRRQCDIPVLIIPGNHDSASRLDYLASIVRDQNIHFMANLEEVGTPVTLGDVDFYGIPFLSPYDLDLSDLDEKYQTRTHENALRAALKKIQLNPHRPNVLIAHLFATGGSTSDSERAFVGASGEVNISLLDQFDYVALGHLHRPQKVSQFAYYSGSPLAYSFSEAGDDKCVLSIELRTGDSGPEEREDPDQKSDSKSPTSSKSPASSRSGKEKGPSTNAKKPSEKQRDMQQFQTQSDLDGQLTLLSDESLDAQRIQLDKDSRMSAKKKSRASRISAKVPEAKGPSAGRESSEVADGTGNSQTLYESAGSGALVEIRKIHVQPLRPVTCVSGFYQEILESQEYDRFQDHYLEVELKDPVIAGSPMNALGARFPYLLSIRRKLRTDLVGDDFFPARQGKSIEDDFKSFQEYLYGSTAGSADSNSKQQIRDSMQTEELIPVQESATKEIKSVAKDSASKPGVKDSPGEADDIATQDQASGSYALVGIDQDELQKEKLALFERELIQLATVGSEPVPGKKKPAKQSKDS